MTPLVDLLHLLLCQKTHIYDMMKLHQRSHNSCYYYLENDISGGEHMPDHESWLAISENFKASLGFRSDQEALKFVKDSIELSRTLRALVNGCPEKLHFIKTILY